MATQLAKPRIRVRAGGIALPAGRPAPGASYMRGEALPLFFRWQPTLREASDDVRAAWRLATARTIDSIQNSGWLAGMVEQSAGSVVGTGLKLNLKPDAASIGMTTDEANEWARHVERRFELWTENRGACDAGNRFTFGQILAQAYRHWLATGEILATFPYFRRSGSAFKSKVKLLPAWRMSTLSMEPDLIHGVRVDKMGAPIQYRIKRKTPYGSEEEVELWATDSAGRPLVRHIFDGEPEQVRGISPLTPILKVTRQFDQLADATLTAALIQAVFAAMFKSPGSGDSVLSAMQSESDEASQYQALLTEKAKWYEKTDINLGVTGKILHGFPGDELEFFRSEHPNSTYESFAKFLLREMSRVCGMTYEEFTGDFSGATYSSVRMGNAVIWPRVLARRKHIVAPLAQAAFVAWLEEDIEAGRTSFPGGVAGFLEHREAATRAEWRGPAKPQADDLKAAKAAATWQELGVPDAVIFEEIGLDVDDAYEQRKREQDRRKALGLEDRKAKPDPVGDAMLTERESEQADDEQQQGASNG